MVNIPFFSKKNIEHIGANPHGRRILAGMFRLNMIPESVAVDFPTQYDDMKAHFEGYAETSADRMNPMLIRLGAMSESRFTELAVSLAATDAWDVSIKGLSPVQLANPLLPATAIQTLLEKDISDAARGLLRANPNCPRELSGAHVYKTSRNKEEELYYAMGIAKYGSLHEPENEEFLLEHMERPDTQHIANMLAWRDDISEPLLEAIDKQITGPAREVLMKNIAHQSHVTNDLLAGDNLDRGGKTLYLSPAIRVGQLENIFYHAKLSDSERTKDPNECVAVVALHRNTSRDTIDDALEIAATHQFIAKGLKDCQSPSFEYLMRKVHEAKIVECDTTIASNYQRASPEFLQWSAETAIAAKKTDSMIDLLSHRKFPWKSFSRETLLESVGENQWATLAALESLADANKGEELGDLCAGAYCPAALFSPTLSGVRLEKIAATSPAMTALAAIHPNGGDISIKGLTSKTQKIVRAMRVNSEENLPGRSGAEIGTRDIENLTI